MMPDEVEEYLRQDEQEVQMRKERMAEIEFLQSDLWEQVGKVIARNPRIRALIEEEARRSKSAEALTSTMKAGETI
jgi:hypothetical protein